LYVDWPAFARQINIIQENFNKDDRSEDDQNALDLAVMKLGKLGKAAYESLSA
jgi:hypothetical protein